MSKWKERVKHQAGLDNGERERRREEIWREERVIK
jgi:hypothetical protein